MDLFLREATDRIGIDDPLFKIDRLLDWAAFSSIDPIHNSAKYIWAQVSLPIFSDCFQIDIGESSDILSNHVLLSIVPINIRKYIELFHAANTMFYADA